MKGALAGVFVGLMIVILIGIGVVVPVVNDFISTATDLTSVTNENITFALNNTYYNLAHTPVDESNKAVQLYYFANTTYPLPASRFAYSNNQVKIYANGTGGFPNVTNGSSSFYYAYYDYQASGYVKSGTSRTILGFFVLLIVVIIIIAIVGSIGLGGRK